MDVPKQPSIMDRLAEKEKLKSAKPAETPTSTKSSKAIDFSAINPETEWECYGTIDKDNPECQECPFAKGCEEKKELKNNSVKA